MAVQVILLKDVEKVGLRGEGNGQQPQYVPAGDVRADQSDFGPTAADDDIPF